MSKNLIAILAGGWSGEREVSLAGGRSCAEALREAGREVVLIDPVEEIERLFQLKPQIRAVLINLHGPFGEDGRIQGLLDCLGLPYAGAGVAASAMTIDKILTKERYRQVGLRVADDVVLRVGEPVREEAVVEKLGLPLIVKPARQGSTLGLTFVESAADVKPALDLAFEYGPRVIVEEYLLGTELTVGVLDLPDHGLTALPIVEIRPKRSNLFNYECKYTPGACDEICPAPISEQATKKAQAAALTAHEALDIEHYSRTDFVLSEDEVYILETNTIPGMTVTSLLPRAARAVGLDLAALLERLIELALRDRGQA